MSASRGEAVSNQSWSDHEPSSRDDRTREGRNCNTSRMRSRSPNRRQKLTAGKGRRSASPYADAPSSHGYNHAHHHDHHRRRSHHKSRHASNVSSGPLPFSARLLTRSDYSSFEPLFAHYLDLQKQKYLHELDEREARGRWKSFMGKWNRNELAEGWYDPEMFAKCHAEYTRGADGSRWEGENSEPGPPRSKPEASRRAESPRRNAAPHVGNSDEDDEYGPALASANPRLKGRVGAKIPTRHDLSLRNELHAEQREDEREELRHARKADRTLQKERLEELVPRAEPGTRERKLEKKQEVNEKMRQFRDKSPGMEAADDREVMGGGDELEEYKKEKEREQKRKTERQARREEFERAKQEEMEERRRAWQEREEGTVSMLRELAKQRFG